LFQHRKGILEIHTPHLGPQLTQQPPTNPSNHSPIWNFDGSSTGQAPGDDSEVLLKPQAIFPDPFRGGKNILVMCDCYKPDMTPIKNNTRKKCAEMMEKVKAQVPWFGIEQEYTLFEADGVTPFGWPKGALEGCVRLVLIDWLID
jgi:glutamine synthetase